MMFVDGSVSSDLPMDRVKELFNVNTFIVSQVNPFVAPFVTVDRTSVLDTNFKRWYVRKFKTAAGNTIKFLIKQLSLFGLLPGKVSSIASMVYLTHKGHITIVPSPTLYDYRLLLTDIGYEDYWRCHQAQYVQSLRSKYMLFHSHANYFMAGMAHIRSYFGIEREFERYYQLLKNQLRDGANFDDIGDEDTL